METSDKDVLMHLAREATSSQTAEPRLRELAAHENATVRKAAARNPRMPADVLAALMKDPEWQKFIEGQPKVLVSQETRILNPVSFSPLK